MNETPNETPPPPERHLWQFPLGRDLIWIIVVIGTFWVAIELAAILGPMLIGLTLAYMTFPLVQGLHRKWGIPRVVSAGGTVGAFVLVLVGMIWILAPQFTREVSALAERAPEMIKTVMTRMGYEANLLDAWLDDGPAVATQPAEAEMEVNSPLGPEIGRPRPVMTLPDAQAEDANAVAAAQSTTDEATTKPAETQPATAPASQPTRVAQMMDSALGYARRAWDMVLQALSSATYFVVAMVLIVVVFFYASTHLHKARDLKHYLPASRQDYLWGLLLRFDSVISGFLRGQLLMVVIITCLLWIGWSLVQVPYWFLLSVLTGALCFIPYVGVVGALVAVAVKAVAWEAMHDDFSWLEVVILPFGVYLLVQGLESWLITPLIQGYATRIHPIGVIIAVSIGGAVGGLMGMLLAVPVAAILKIVVEDVAAPWLRGYMKKR